MKEYIEREALLKTPPFTKCVSDFSEYSEGYLDCVQDMCKTVREAPAADVAPIIHAHWEWREFYGEPGLMLCCSKCRETEGANMRFEYCPHCGAMMRGG